MQRRWIVCLLTAVGLAIPSAALTAEPAMASGSPVEIGSTPVIVSGHQGFDSCSNLTLSGLSTWWTNSPYWNVGFYLPGGETSVGAGCAQYNSTWRSSVTAQGWGFLPIWDGLQAPCQPKNGPPISSTTSTAYQQGLNDAANATNAANALGITNPTVIYLDMENWPYSYHSSCYWAVGYYISGFVKGLHNYGSSAGVYGNPGSTLLTEKTLLGSGLNTPDEIWIAQYLAPTVTEYSTTYGSGPMNVWGIPYIADGYWVYDQRHQQYTGGHYENSKWGYLGPTIDSDCNDGPVSKVNYVHNTQNGDPYNEAYNEPSGANEANGSSEDSLCQ